MESDVDKSPTIGPWTIRNTPWHEISSYFFSTANTLKGTLSLEKNNLSWLCQGILVNPTSFYINCTARSVTSTSWYVIDWCYQITNDFWRPHILMLSLKKNHSKEFYFMCFEIKASHDLKPHCSHYYFLLFNCSVFGLKPCAHTPYQR